LAASDGLLVNGDRSILPHESTTGQAMPIFEPAEAEASDELGVPGVIYGFLHVFYR